MHDSTYNEECCVSFCRTGSDLHIAEVRSLVSVNYLTLIGDIWPHGVGSVKVSGARLHALANDIIYYKFPHSNFAIIAMSAARRIDCACVYVCLAFLHAASLRWHDGRLASDCCIYERPAVTPFWETAAWVHLPLSLTMINTIHFCNCNDQYQHAGLLRGNNKTVTIYLSLSGSLDFFILSCPCGVMIDTIQLI
jgi:hypothetical protein